MTLKEIATQNQEPEPKKKKFIGNIQAFDNLTKKKLDSAKKFNIFSNIIFLEMNEDTTKYKVSRAYQPHLN